MTDPIKKGAGNIPKEISGAKSTGLKFDPQDAATAELVKEFMAEKSAESEAPPDGDEARPEGEQITQPQVEITPNQEFDGGDTNQQFISEALAPINRVEITEAEKVLFLKAVLNDAPVKFPVTLYNGQMTVDVRSRSSYEQKRVFDILKLDQQEGLYEQADVAMMITRMHYYLGVLMVERINGTLFSELKLMPGTSIEQDTKVMREAASKLFEGMSSIRWTSILNALRIFEHKCAKMNSEALNEGFWTPQG